MKITIVGAGNIGTQFAVHAAEVGNEVTIYTSNPNIINKKLIIINENDEIIHTGVIKNVTNNEKEAFEEANLIFITYPAFMMDEIAQKILPFVSNGLKICLVPGTGGGECAFKKCIEKGAIIFGMQRVPSVARLIEKGKSVRAIGYRDKLYIASIPKKENINCAKIIFDIFKISCEALPNYLNVTLTPSNPILHTTRLKTIFKDYYNGKKYESIPLFYEDWNDESSILLFKCDEEVQNICKKLNDYDLSYVKSLKIHYESNTPHDLTQKIKSIIGFKGLITPSLKVDNYYLPNLNDRYFTADFNYGLNILIQISKFLKLDCSSMISVWSWYKEIMIFKQTFNFKDYNINSLDDFLNFYNK